MTELLLGSGRTQGGFREPEKFNPRLMALMADKLEWFGNAGRFLDKVSRKLPSKMEWQITVCGFSPLRLHVESQPSSVGPIALDHRDVSHHLGDAELVDQDGSVVIICAPLTFRSTFDWRARAIEVERHGHLFRFVHPWDVLVSKLQWLEEKDLDAFRLVIAKTGHPTEQEFRRHLQKAVDLYRPKFDEETQRGDMMANTRLLWRELWGRDIDPRAEIIRPAAERTNRAHSDYDPTLKRQLADVRLPAAASLFVPR